MIYDNENNKNIDYQNGNSFDNNSPANPSTPVFRNSPFYYSESLKKKKSKKGFNLFQVILIAVLSSILGGGVVFLAFQVVAPAIQPDVDRCFDRILAPSGLSSNAPGNQELTSYKIEIEKTDSPVVWIAKKVSPSIVGIRVTARVQNFLFGEQQSTGGGSGIIIREDGYILTNYHVIEYAYDSSANTVAKNAKIEVFLLDQKDKPYTAEIVGVDWRTDLAVIKIDATNLPAAELGDSDKIEVGELAVAIGNPASADMEFMGTVTAGIISGLDRTIMSESGYEFKLIQTDAAINPGNSGGALVNSEGKVIGVNSIKIVATGYEGIGFAIPINTARKVAEDLIEHKYVPGRPYIGIKVDSDFDESMARYYRVPVGVLVREVIPFSGAYKAGIKVGDIITKCEGKAVKNLQELNAIKNNYKPGDVIKLEVYRNGQYMEVEVELTEERLTFEQ
ncbi:MAG: PDZ domain-containing protein [Clostridiaceae bacterium]|nr:PDZ domain-containing protein [Clostridiaceae bacterium]